MQESLENCLAKHLVLILFLYHVWFWKSLILGVHTNRWMASYLYQMDALCSSDSYLIYFSSCGNNLPTPSLQKFVYHVCKKKHSLPSQTIIYYHSSKRDFLVFNFETDCPTLSLNRQRELLTIFLFTALPHILVGASLFFFRPVFSRNTNSGIQISLTRYRYSPPPYLLSSSLELAFLSLKVQPKHR